MGVYIVQKGDTLSGIAGRLRGNKTAWRDIVEASALKNPNRLQIGQRLEIPDWEPPQVEGMPTPATNPRREFSQSRGRAFGPPPVKHSMPPMGPSARAMGAEEMAIPEELTFADTAGAMSERFGSMPSPHRTGNVQTMPPPTQQPRAPDPEVGGLLVRGQPKLTAPAGPDFSMADRPGPTFDPPTQAKIAAMMRVFEQQPQLVDRVIQSLWGQAAAAE